jgi:hypothetical protein
MTVAEDRLGRIPSPPDSRDHPLSLYVPVKAVEPELPKAFLRRQPSLPVYDQIGPSCVGYGSALMGTIDQRRDHRRTLMYDGLELYDRCKQVDGYPGGGTYPRIAHKIRQEHGMKVASSRVKREVGSQDYIAAYAALHSLNEIKVAIYLFGSAGLGSTWYDNWDDSQPDGFLPPGSYPVGGHWYVAVGWNDRLGALVCQNSWGSWGVRIGGVSGRFYLPYEFVDFSDFEAWRTVDVDDS